MLEKNSEPSQASSKSTTCSSHHKRSGTVIWCIRCAESGIRPEHLHAPDLLVVEHDGGHTSMPSKATRHLRALPFEYRETLPKLRFQRYFQRSRTRLDAVRSSWVQKDINRQPGLHQRPGVVVSVDAAPRNIGRGNIYVEHHHAHRRSAKVDTAQEKSFKQP